jgi:two-component system sensor histidine kinase HydH
MTKLRARLLAFGRWGLLLALLALGVAMVFSAWTNRRDAERISALLDRGQSERFFHGIPELHERNGGAATAADLGKLLTQFQAEGLRYLAEYDARGALIAEAGEYVGRERPRPTGMSSQPELVGERVRVAFRPPHAAPGLEPERRPPPAEGPRPGAHRPGLQLPDLVIEFEPTVANELRGRANKSFAFSITAASSLFLLTLGLWLALTREERNRERNERERHLASLGEMSAVLAHEIRNPLASLKGHAQLLGEQLASDSPLQKKVTRIVDEAKRLEDLSSTLLDLVRSSSVSRRPTDPAQLLRDAAQGIDAERIVIDASDAPASWLIDPLRMEQVFKNVLQNAVQASPDGGRVEASVSAVAGKLVVVVRDHGAGLPAGAEQRVFEAFHTTRTQGTGLGLAVARRVVELHGGHIRAENHTDGGAVFTLAIPS